MILFYFVRKFFFCFSFNIITSFPFLSSKPSHVPLLVPVKSKASSFIDYCGMHLYLGIHFLLTLYATCMYFTRIIIWYWTANGCALSWRRLFITLSVFLSCLWFLVYGYFLRPFSQVYCCGPCCLLCPIVKILWV